MAPKLVSTLSSSALMALAVTNNGVFTKENDNHLGILVVVPQMTTNDGKCCICATFKWSSS